MDFSIATLLSHLSDDKLATGKLLEKKLGCEDDPESCEKLQVILDALERLGMVVKERGRYRRVPVKNFALLSKIAKMLMTSTSRKIISVTLGMAIEF
jgi:ribosomal protein S19E (S16A)